MSRACKRCNFDDAFIIDYMGTGEEYTFCGNCGKIKEVLNTETNNPDRGNTAELEHNS